MPSVAHDLARSLLAFFHGVTKRILVADDNQAIRRSVCGLFDGHAFLGVRYEASDGKQAVEEAKKHRPDLIILDLAMPEVDGIEAAKTIHTLLPEIPIILLTLYADVIQPSDILGFTRMISKSNMRSVVGVAEELLSVASFFARIRSLK